MKSTYANIHPYVYYAIRYSFSRNQKSGPRACYTSSIYLISEGKGVLEMGGKTYVMEPGTLMYIPAGKWHVWMADGSDPMVHICCYFDWFHVDRIAFSTHPGVICWDLAQFDSRYMGPSFPADIQECSQVEKLGVWIDQFESFYTSNEFITNRALDRNLITQSNFNRFIQFFLAYMQNSTSRFDRRIYKLIVRIEQDILNCELKPLHTYYATLGTSRGYFFMLFRQVTGVTPVQYINNLKLKQAKEALRGTSLSVTEIAEKYQFSSVHYFSRMFRKATGETPRQYRSHHRMW